MYCELLTFGINDKVRKVYCELLVHWTFGINDKVDKVYCVLLLPLTGVPQRV